MRPKRHISRHIRDLDEEDELDEDPEIDPGNYQTSSKYQL